MTKEDMEKIAALLPPETVFVMVRDEKSSPPATVFWWSAEWMLKCAGDIAATGICLNSLADAGEAFLAMVRGMAEELEHNGVN